jgi:hypothetical protein
MRGSKALHPSLLRTVSLKNRLLTVRTSTPTAKPFFRRRASPKPVMLNSMGARSGRLTGDN